MTVKKGLSSLVNATPDFSNQALENAVNQLKIGWVAKTFTLDTAIKNNSVLTTTQKNNARLTINNQPHLNIGRYINDALDHTGTILDGTIVHLANPDAEDPATFLEILQTVQSLQTLIPDLYGVPASEKNRDVNDHFGTLNNKFLQTEDSSRPVFTSLLDSIQFINNKSLATDTLYQTALTNMTTFVDSVVGDSTDFQQTLDTFATAVATAATNFNTALAAEPLLTKRTLLIADNEAVDVQVALEKANLVGIRTYSESLTNNLSYTALADDKGLRDLMLTISQNASWKSYFANYEANSAALNPLYTTGTDSDKAGIVEEVLRARGLPDVTTFLDLTGVAEKATKDSRIDTKGFDLLTSEEIITKSCQQLNLTTARRSIYDQSKQLLSNLDKRDRDLIADELNLNEDADTLS
tara:strand:+ start:11369 stop:12601 length:1233 start_codon:yes stop_codon:yes gene_type:complete